MHKEGTGIDVNDPDKLRTWSKSLNKRPDENRRSCTSRRQTLRRKSGNTCGGLTVVLLGFVPVTRARKTRRECSATGSHQRRVVLQSEVID